MLHSFQNGSTALTMASSRHDKSDVVKLLLEAGADVNAAFTVHLHAFYPPAHSIFRLPRLTSRLPPMLISLLFGVNHDNFPATFRESFFFFGGGTKIGFFIQTWPNSSHARRNGRP